jgi:hemerythrin
MRERNSDAMTFQSPFTNGKASSTDYSQAMPNGTFVADAFDGSSLPGLPMPQTVWWPEIASGLPAMDKLRHDFFASLDGLSAAPDEEFGAGYRSFVTQVEHMFRLEEHWMDDIDFPAFRTHQEQHARALGALHNVHSRVMNGDYGAGREVVDKLLPQWFSFHMSTMDTALGLAMQMAQAEAATPDGPGAKRPSRVVPIAP